jgi:DNA-binding response OmpR family regulator
MTTAMDVPYILIVDDEPNIVMSLEFLMRKNGYQVGIARNGTEALAAINHTPYDLVLLDVMMPDVDGYQVCRHIRENTSRAATKVIFLSAKSQPTDVAQGYAAGADLYIPKPFSTRQLMEKVRELLAASRQAAV